jgi:hypothetical protein
MNSDSKFGMSGQDLFFGLQFNEPSNSLIQHTGRHVANGYIKSLFCRHVNQDKYEILAAGDVDLSYEEFVVANSSPFVYVNVFSIRESSNESGDKSLIHEWYSIKRINIPTKEETTLISNESANMCNGGFERWVSQVLSLGDDELSLIFILGSTPTANGKKRDVQYDLCKLDFKSLDFSIISRMLDPSF